MAVYTLRLKRDKLQNVGMRRAKSLVGRVTRRTFNRSQILVPVDTGNLRASGSIIPAYNLYVGEVTAEVIYTAEYAAAVHNGRRALTIRPKNPNGFLYFKVGGKRVRAKQVHQPARAGRPFLANALREVAGGAQDFEVTIG